MTVPAPATAPADVAHLGVYLSAYLAPFQQWLADENVTEILVNQPGEIWTESAGKTGMARHEAPGIDDVLLNRLAAQVARFSHQGISHQGVSHQGVAIEGAVSAGVAVISIEMPRVQ